MKNSLVWSIVLVVGCSAPIILAIEESEYQETATDDIAVETVQKKCYNYFCRLLS